VPGLDPQRARVLVIGVTVLLTAALAALVIGANGGISVAEVSPSPPLPSATPLPSTTGPTPTAAHTPAPSPTPEPTPQARLINPPSLEPEQLTGYVWPLRNGWITSRFGPRSFGAMVMINGKQVHDGLDLWTGCGDKVRAAHDGVVLYAGRNFEPYIGYEGDASAIYARLQQLGRTNASPINVVIDDGNGYRSMYQHLMSFSVQAGDVVKAGDVIGREGQTGFATGCHLHYTLIRMDGVWLDVVPRLVQESNYPPRVRERVDPLRVLPWGDRYAPASLQKKYCKQHQCEPEVSPSPAATPDR
jgi:murein DD-endopeptidase MepM/ murein hydrolase activator NlpD